MGVTGLWRLIDASGKPVPLETLEGKILAIDISIWIHQVLQGYQDRRGNTVPNAHLLGLYSRICKLLYFKIKPVFVFDGGVPLLKKNTIAARKRQKALAAGKAVQMKNDLLHNLMKHSLVKDVLSHKTKQGNEASTSSSQKNLNEVNDMYRLPTLPINSTEDYDSHDSDVSVELSPRKQAKWKGNIHTVDVTSDDFKALPADVRYDILTDLKETRKQNSWGRLHEMPQETHQFSNYQMQRLLKRRKVQESLESAEQEMGGKNLTLDELEKLMIDQGVDVHGRDTAFRIAADSTTRLIYVNDLKALKSRTETSDSSCKDANKPGCSSEQEFNETLSPILEESTTIVENIDEYDLDDDWDSDIEVINQPIDSRSVKKFFGSTTINPALSYMLEHSGLSQEQIFTLIQQSKENTRNANKNEKKSKRPQLNFDDETILSKKQKKKNSDLNVELIQNIKEEPENLPSEKLSVLISSDSESDCFIEVSDVPLPHTLLKNQMEITVKPDEKLKNEDDIFADVFEAESIKDCSNNSLEISKPECIEMNSPIDEKLDFISESIEINPLIEEKSFENVTLQSETIFENDQQKSIENQEELPEVVDDNMPKASLKKNSDQSSEENTENISNTLNETVALQTKKDHVIDPEELPQLPTDTSVPIIEREVSGMVEAVIDRLNKDKEELLANMNRSEELLNMKSQLENENRELKENIGKLERQATEVTDQMRSDAQDLLRLFGIPYVVAPQEAEAQCAYLEMVNLTDGTITDDSDIWLFGGRCVYKHFFNNAKRVMEYRSKDIEHHFKLSREQMIQLALLVGSDYTVGISGIGPVTGLEILANFPAEGEDLLKGLIKFSSWIKAGRQVGPGRTALRNKLKNIVVDQGFPSQAVVQAYLFPTVDESKEIFSWSEPNLVLLSDYTREKFGWSKSKFEETMGPVMKRFSDTKTQKNIMSYFKVQTVPQSIDKNLSKRVQKAVQMMEHQGTSADDDSDNVAELLKDVKQDGEKNQKKKLGRKTKGVSNNEDDVHQTFEIDTLTKNSLIKQNGKDKEEFIPQREKERAAALKKKLKAIEVFRKSRNGPGKSGKKNVRPIRKAVKKEAELSESSSDTD